MEIEYVAFDSFGIKSDCFYIKTKDVRVTVDPGIASETGSFPLTTIEKAKLDLLYKRRIKQACRNSDVIVITHYHYDHHIPEPGLYKGKILLIKDPKKNINKSQKGRAAYFLEQVEGKAREIRIADGKRFRFGKTRIEVSKPLWHGTIGTKLGKVLMVTIDDGKERLVYTSDVDGPYNRETADLIIKEKPSILILDPFPSYLLGFIASFANLKKVLLNTIRILEKTHAELYILDHHLLRDYRYREIYYEVYKRAKELGKKVSTAAEVLGKKPKVIEGYEKNGPTRWKKWDRMTFAKLGRMIAHAKKAKTL